MIMIIIKYDSSGHQCEMHTCRDSSCFLGGAQTSHLFAVSPLRAVAGIGPLTRQAAASGETEPLA